MHTVLPLPLQPPAAGEDETLADVLQHHILVITHTDAQLVMEREGEQESGFEMQAEQF